MKRTVTIIIGVIGLLAAGALVGWLYFRANPGAWDAFLAEMEGETSARPAPERAQRRPVSDDALLASGTIEATDISVASETGGRVQSIEVEEGDRVAKGALLLQIDTSALALQQAGAKAAVDQARAALDAAQAQLALAQAGARQQEVSAAESAVDAAGAGIDAAEAQLRAAEGQLAAAQAGQDQAEARLEAAEEALAAARSAAQAAGADQESDASVGEVTANVAIAQAALDAAEAAIQIAEAGVEAARAGVDGAESQRDQAQATLDLLRAGAREEEIALLEANVAQARSALAGAEATLAGIDIQIDRMELAAPIDGVVVHRLIEPGELASPGAPLLLLADLERVTLTVYVPQANLGQVSLGQMVEVTVDAYDQVFQGEVSHIASRAEFTPSNVQTEAERVHLVFAVQIKLSNPDQALKPGMPADAVFQSSGSS